MAPGTTDLPWSVPFISFFLAQARQARTWWFRQSRVQTPRIHQPFPVTPGPRMGAVGLQALRPEALVQISPPQPPPLGFLRSFPSIVCGLSFRWKVPLLASHLLPPQTHSGSKAAARVSSAPSVSNRQSGRPWASQLQFSSQALVMGDSAGTFALFHLRASPLEDGWLSSWIPYGSEPLHFWYFMAPLMSLPCSLMRNSFCGSRQQAAFHSFIPFIHSFPRYTAV